MTIFGLGNPGLRYRLTRHNVGYMFCERFARQHRKKFRRKSGYQETTVRIGREEVHLIKPRVWMNQSGVAVASILALYGKPLLVVIDDVNLPLGRMRLRSKGSDGGHLGLRSIIECLEVTCFPRLRIGIGRAGEDVASYVLDAFSRQEKRLLNRVIDEGIQGIKIMIKKDFVKAQNYINSIKIELDADR